MKKLILIFWILCSSSAFGYEIQVHALFSEEAFSSSSAESVLTALEINKPISGTLPIKLVSDGSIYEDDNVRAINHFFDPTTGSGLVGRPAPSWALGEGPLDAINQYSLRHAVDYFFNGLTASTQAERDASLALMFRSLGQIIHLIQDMAVPEHVRSDPHFTFNDDPDNPLNVDRSRYEKYTAAHSSSFTLTGYAVPKFPRFRDYWKNAEERGLAEITNRNFVSKDTNLDDQTHPEPSVGRTFSRVETMQVRDMITGKTETIAVRFLGNIVDAPAAPAENPNLTAFSVFDFDFNAFAGEHIYVLNNVCFLSYGRILFPRAVGYSTGILNQFFSAKIGAAPAGSDLKITNQGEGALAGEVSAYYDSAGVRKKAGSFSVTLGAGQATNGSISLPAGTTRLLIVFKGTHGGDPAIAAIWMSLSNPNAFQFVKIIVSDGNNGRFRLTDLGDVLSPISKRKLFDFVQLEETYRIPPTKYLFIFALYEGDFLSEWNLSSVEPKIRSLDDIRLRKYTALHVLEEIRPRGGTFPSPVRRVRALDEGSQISIFVSWDTPGNPAKIAYLDLLSLYNRKYSTGTISLRGVSIAALPGFLSKPSTQLAYLEYEFPEAVHAFSETGYCRSITSTGCTGFGNEPASDIFPGPTLSLFTSYSFFTTAGQQLLGLFAEFGGWPIF